jgi:nickel/cobalt transporter (NiCoT) family protein
MIEDVQTDWLSLLILTFVLGMKHGFDVDHLATIDGLTRYNTRKNPTIAPYCGSLFSLGHGAIVVAIALGVSSFTERWDVPEWFGTLGVLISIAFLAVIGCLNLMAVFRAPSDELVRPIGLKGQLLGSLRQVSHPLLVALVGALFALSFDTLSQAAFFALTASQFGGWHHALIFSLVFTLGMLVTDGINGFWIAHLIARADQVALIASRVMSMVVSVISLMVCAFGVLKLSVPALDGWAEGKELLIGLGLLLMVAASYQFSMRLGRKQACTNLL